MQSKNRWTEYMLIEDEINYMVWFLFFYLCFVISVPNLLSFIMPKLQTIYNQTKVYYMAMYFIILIILFSRQFQRFEPISISIALLSITAVERLFETIFSFMEYLFIIFRGILGIYISIYIYFSCKRMSKLFVIGYKDRYGVSYKVKILYDRKCYILGCVLYDVAMMIASFTTSYSGSRKNIGPKRCSYNLILVLPKLVLFGDDCPKSYYKKCIYLSFVNFAYVLTFFVIDFKKYIEMNLLTIYFTYFLNLIIMIYNLVKIIPILEK